MPPPQRSYPLDKRDVSGWAKSADALEEWQRHYWLPGKYKMPYQGLTQMISLNSYKAGVMIVYFDPLGN